MFREHAGPAQSIGAGSLLSQEFGSAAWCLALSLVWCWPWQPAFWARNREIEIEVTQPGKPTHNVFIERFNGTYRKEVLDVYLFRSLDEVREETERWLAEYNSERPHGSHGNMTPVKFLIDKGHVNLATYAW